MKEGIIDFETIDGMFAHRFFMSMNNPFIKQLLLYYKGSWKNLLGLYTDWKRFKLDHNEAIVQHEYIWDEDQPWDKDIPCWFPRTIAPTDVPTYWRA